MNLILFTQADEDTYVGNLRRLMAWAPTVEYQRRLTVNFVDDYADNTAQNNAQMRRILYSQGAPVGRQIGYVIPFRCGVVAITIASTVNVVGGSLSFRLRAGGTAVSAIGDVSFSSGTSKVATFNRNKATLAAGTVIDVTANGTGQFSGDARADMEVGIHLVEIV